MSVISSALYSSHYCLQIIQELQNNSQVFLSSLKVLEKKALIGFDIKIERNLIQNLFFKKASLFQSS